jgi:hypothetical protein
MPSETTPLLPASSPSRLSLFFQKISREPIQTLKKLALVVASAFSGYMYWPSSFNAAAFGGKTLQVTAALGGSATNAIFNYESFLSLAELPKFRSMPSKYLTATLFSIACVAPNFFMDIVDEEGNYIDTTSVTLQASTAFLNIWVNVVGSLELINSIANLFKNKTELEKEKLTEKFKQDIKKFSQLSDEEQTQDKLVELLNESFNSKKIMYYSLIISIGLLSIPQFLAYVFISYFGMKDLSEKRFGANPSVSILLASIAAIGNAIPNAGFSIKGVNSSSKKIISLEKPSLLATLFILPALFSGFTTHKAMADSLKALAYSGNMTESLNWLSNLGAALIYNLPQMLALANRLGNEKTVDAGASDAPLSLLQKNLENEISSLKNCKEITDFKNNLTENNDISNFFKEPHQKNHSNSSHQVMPSLCTTV